MDWIDSALASTFRSSFPALHLTDPLFPVRNGALALEPRALRLRALEMFFFALSCFGQ